MNFLANVLNAGACVIASNPSVSQFCVNLGADLIFPSTPPKWESNVPSGLEGADRLPFQGLRDKFFQGQPKEKVGKRRIKELNQRIHKQFDALELGASRMLKVGVLFSSIGGLNFSDHSRFAEIHSENLASEKDFKRAIFNERFDD